jgi:hypothetical protein
MPIRIERTDSSQESGREDEPALLPTELFFRIGFADMERAREWAERAVEALGAARVPVAPDDPLHRIVVAAPRRQSPGVRLTGHGFVFMSELALRALRTLGRRSIPTAEPVALERVERGLEMLAGHPVDRAALEEWASG